ncbi:inositol-3-phosphate synthase [Egicoccus halophilus]|uniref:Myo-inositol-1-phosphate synthase n=1 Tax=Egicoccus halophilus TaxID=1670830 RepID=A0A8J3A5D3_9ACTN|nr:inositol-3-phosphate synthase [Egicoccus halophilus]GGI03459.1 myo-inositol-1-phosphate synthase [Egicoccus halophilus]
MGDIGIWLVGGRGSVATTAMVGAAALGAGAATAQGMVTATPGFPADHLPDVDRFVFGGQDVGELPLVKQAERLAGAGVLPSVLPGVVVDRLIEIEARIHRCAAPGEVPPRTAIEAMVRDLERFRREHALAQLIVINLASTEAPPAWTIPPVDDDALEVALDDWSSCPPSLVATLAALHAGAAYVDFTPGAALTAPAVLARARATGLPVAGRDGKTGETLLKSVLAPMFAHRNLTVRSWSGTNLLGGGDGARLADPEHAASKLASKGRTVANLLGEDVHQTVHIDCVPDLGEWKTAWNHISFAGFLGTAMSLQLTWQGCDSTLAAPLVLDLARLTSLALSRGESGALTPLAYFFKDPVGSDDHAFATQLLALERWAAA